MTRAELERLLDHNATDPARVSEQVVREQLHTAAALRRRLDSYGGAILGDEVGAGKTFTTFAVLAEALLREPNKGAVIFVPTELLRGKWGTQLRDYLRAAVRDRDRGEELARRVVTIDRSLRDSAGKRPGRRSIVIARHSVFAYRTSDADRAVCLSAWLEKRWPGRRRPWKRLFEACGLELGYHDNEEWATWASPADLDHPQLKPLDELASRWEDGERDLRRVLADGVQSVRRELGRRVLPNAALVVIDEAHNLRSTSSQVYQSLMHVLSARFDALLFLTATPFQLGRHELRNVVDFFKYARAYEGRHEEFERRVAAMEGGMATYVEALRRFGDAWRLLDAAEVDEARELSAQPAEAVDETRRAGQAAARFRGCLDAKDLLEEGLRPFLVRSVRLRDHHEHHGLERDASALAPESRIPLALVDRLITELLARKERTFIASALTSSCSSWEALFDAAIAQRGIDDAARTRTLLGRMQDEGAIGEHPKVAHTVHVCLEGIGRGEKTLVFVERQATGEVIRDQINARLGDWHDRTAWQRLQTPTRFGWPSLRENYLHTLYPDVFGAPPDENECLAALQTEYARNLWRRVDVEGVDRDYKIEKRLIEHAVFKAAIDAGLELRPPTSAASACLQQILDPRYVLNGLDLQSGASGETIEVPSQPARAEPRDPNFDFARAYVRYPSPWVTCIEQLRELGPEARAEVVDASASAVARSHLQAEIAQKIAETEVTGDPHSQFHAVDRLLRGTDSVWTERFRALSEQALEMAVGQSPERSAERIDRLAAALRSGQRVQFVHGGTKHETRQNAVDGFNTPLYPEVIIATPILAEGLDLHRHCRRVIHHDLPWNPAKLEQRTGRVDRIGSFAQRLAEEGAGDGDASIHVWLPFMHGTYDETIFERVLARRREFRCVLGNRPEWEQETLGEDESGPPMDETLVEALQAQLGPE